MTVTTVSPAAMPVRARILAAAGWAFPVAIGLSACLLFTLELMVGLLLLPLLGGAPSVWATTLAFFQLVLLLGYLYAHLSVTRFGRLGPGIHLVLALVAMAALVFGPRMADVHAESLHPVLQVLAMLALAVGLPAFTLCATTPLLSAWLTDVLAAGRVGTSVQEPAKDPYRLYVVSNTGSLLALLAYPLLIEPAVGLRAQQVVWGVLFSLFVALLAVVGGLRLRTGRVATSESSPTSDGEHLPVRRVLRWLFLAAVPCGMLSAVTNFITSDLISAPMLWVGPLGIYLATFIVAFSARGTRTIAVATALAPAMATLLWIPFGYSAMWPTLPLLLIELFGFAAVALTLHGALAADRPGPTRLTFFYLVVSAGGVLGGSFVGLLAPVVFPGIWEYPILLVAALAAFPVGAAARAAARAAPTPARRGLNLRPFVAGARTRVLPFAVIGAVCALLIGISQPISLIAVVPSLVLGGFILLVGARPQLLAATTAIVLASVVLVQPVSPIFQERDFFGVVEVRRDATVTIMWHGTTNHGGQWTDPARAMEPRGYYDRRGPLGDVMALAQSRGAQRIGIVGLGAGGIAAYERPVDRITYFEIDPAVVRAAEDTNLFTYLSKAPNRPDIVLGDGRIELRKVPDASFDLLIVDAFTGDAIPTHLMTVEAIREAERTLKPGGLFLFHVSNRYYDLAPAVTAAAREVGMTAITRTYQPSGAEMDQGAQACSWVVATVQPDQVAPLAAKGWSAVPAASTPITDDYPDVLRFAKFGSWLTSK